MKFFVSDVLMNCMLIFKEMLVKYLHRAWETVDCIGEKMELLQKTKVEFVPAFFCSSYNLADEEEFIQK